ELDSVSLAVKGKETPVLKDVSIKINTKDRLLIQGASGSGKTSLLKLIAGVISPTMGSIYINDKSLTSINVNSYRANIGQTLVEETPFEGTLLQNLTFGDTSITNQQIDWAIKNVGLKDFVKQLPNGLNTMLYPEGKGTSFTVAKKIMLARSIIKQPKLLMLKEPLDQFEPNDAQQIIDFLSQPDHPWALVVVSQNNLWKTKLNRVITLDKGQIINNN
ncbi:MAG: ATP-binding cassette domain-containing protein, partial [Olleya sp.]